MNEDTFLKKLWETNRYYREGQFSLLDNFVNDKTSIRTVDNYGICSRSIRSLLSNNPNDIKTAVNKLEYASNILKDINPKIAKEYNLIGLDGSKYIVETKYGKIRASLSEMKGHKSIPINSAINRNIFWITRCADLREDFKDIDYSKCNYVNNSIKVELRCKLHDYVYSQRPSHHTANIQGCPYCMTQVVKYTKENIEVHRDFIESIKGVLYVIEMSSKEEFFYKIGIVSKHRFDYRMTQFKKLYNVKILGTKDMDMVSAFNMEQFVLKMGESVLYRPLKKFAGYTECLTVNPIEIYNGFEKLFSEYKLESDLLMCKELGLNYEV